MSYFFTISVWEDSLVPITKGYFAAVAVSQFEGIERSRVKRYVHCMAHVTKTHTYITTYYVVVHSMSQIQWDWLNNSKLN